MAYHSVVKTSYDYYTALWNARNIAADLTDQISTLLGKTVEIFPYSIFYVYYEQYLTIGEDALISLGSSLAAVFIVTLILTGLDIISSFLIIVNVTAVLINMTGMLYWWGITLNAISLVNLVVVSKF